MSEFRELVVAQELSVTDIGSLTKICTSWEGFSNSVGKMTKAEVLKTLKYLMEKRPHSRTFGERAVQRYNSLNRVRWGELYNGN